VQQSRRGKKKRNSSYRRSIKFSWQREEVYLGKKGLYFISEKGGGGILRRAQPLKHPEEKESFLPKGGRKGKKQPRPSCMKGGGKKKGRRKRERFPHQSEKILYTRGRRNLIDKKKRPLGGKKESPSLYKEIKGPIPSKERPMEDEAH